jgi:hypothetical protein
MFGGAVAIQAGTAAAARFGQQYVGRSHRSAGHQRHSPKTREADGFEAAAVVSTGLASAIDLTRANDSKLDLKRGGWSCSAANDGEPDDGFRPRS